MEINQTLTRVKRDFKSSVRKAAIFVGSKVWGGGGI